ncbi:MFS transporter [Phytomonospora sp. NPDC050363]|uniref:MFS transporter n=1 Tax=Phytomonospora sp. NPDC050363 TaxID=3155642 RepID=UPI0033DAFB89
MATITRPMAIAPAAVRPRAARATVPAVWLVVLSAPLALSANSPAMILPTLAADLSVSLSTVSWLVSAFGWAMALGTPLMGGLVRRRGIRAVLLTGSGLTAAGTVLAALSPWLPLLLAGRALQALGGSALVAVAMNLAGGSPRRMGLIAAGFGVLGATGPLVGATLTSAASWHVAFAVQAVTLLAVPAVLRRDLPSVADPGSRFDATGAALLAVLVTALVAVPHYPLAGAVGVLLAAVPLELRIRANPEGFVPAALLRTPAFLVSSGLTLLLSTSYFAMLFAVPRLLGAATTWSTGAIGAGQMAAMITGSALVFGFAAISPRLPHRLIAPLLVGIGTLALALALVTPWAPLLLAVSTLSLLASSGGQAVLGVRAMRAAPEGQRPVAIGLFNLAFQLGGAFGPTLVVLLAV